MLETGLPSFDTVMHNSTSVFARSWQNCTNNLVQYLRFLAFSTDYVIFMCVLNPSIYLFASGNMVHITTEKLDRRQTEKKSAKN